MACVALAAAAFVLVTYAWRALETGAGPASASMAAGLEQRLRESRTKVARLPQLREAVRGEPAPVQPAERPAGGDWRAIMDLASRSGVTLRALEPASGTGAARAREGQGAGRALHLDAHADFASLHAFLAALSTLPMLAVPEAVLVKREKDGLALDATLNVFDVLPAQPTLAAGARASAAGAADGGAARGLADPFGVAGTGAAQGLAAGRLVGLMHDGRHSLALFEGASGTQSSAAISGQTMGSERIVHIDTLGVTLSGRGGTRRITLSEEAR